MNHSYDEMNKNWTDLSCDLSEPIKGIQDLFFSISGSAIEQFEFDSWQFSEEATGVQAPKASHPAVTRIYDLQGRQVNDSQDNRSIIIMNGKKVIKSSNK